MRPPAGPGCRVDVIHHITCRHQVEVEVSPPRAELYFGDERWTDPLDTQIRFEATVFNSGRGVRWQVYDAAGGPGAGTIDATGLYQAPAKGGLKSGHTEVIVATSVEDPLRKAYAWVTLIGVGPLKAPDPRINDNAYIDDSNKIQLFQATIWNSAIQTVSWQVFSGAGAIDANGLYRAPNFGADHQLAIIRAYIDSTTVYDEARVVLLNYVWPGLH